MLVAVLALVGCGGGVRTTDAPITTTTTAAGATTTTRFDTAPFDALVAQAPPETCLVVATDGRIRYEHHADRALIPASAIKLVTAAAALAHLDAGEGLGADGPTVGEMVTAALSDSDAAATDRLLVALGARATGEATVEAGARAVAPTLADSGIPTTGLVVTDGSGFDRGNRVTCRTLNALLEAYASGPLGAGLAVAGERGTLADRYADGPAAGRLLAKTGSIRGVTALAGTISGRNGDRLTFAFMVNGLEGDDTGRQLQDVLVAALIPER